MFVQFEIILPRILEAVASGSTIDSALKSLRPLMTLETGPFLTWLKKRPAEYALYVEAKELRTEVWTGRYLQHATGVDSEGETTLNDVNRDKLAMDAYKWLISTQNRKEYGDVKTLEVNQQISIVGALDAARARALSSVEVVDVDALSESDYQQARLLTAGSDDDSDDEDE